LEICGDGDDNDCDPDTSDSGDLDGDGEDCSTDCDDSNATIGNNLPEICTDLLDNDCDGLIDLEQTNVVLAQFGSSMRYLANTADPGLALTWVTHGFNDNSWTNGVYGVGYELFDGADNLIATEVSLDTDSVYTRAKFTIPDATGVTELFFAADWDDAYVVWINGTEVLRSPEMPPGEPLWNSDPELHESSNGLVPDYGTLIDISSAIPLLASGLNTMAVGIYNNIPAAGGQSSDLVLVPRLSMTYGTDDPECLCEDLDNDGYAGGACAVDCADLDPNISPGLPEIGCDGIDNDCDNGTPDNLDADGDGVDCSTDCDDNAADTYPGAPEIPCDFADNDCSPGTPDLVDADNDTFDCFADCNDLDPNVNPLQAEVFCDGENNDCNTLTPDVVDADSDGFNCDAECDDADAAINPAAAENCLDGVDNDCDGDMDGDDADCDVGCPDDDGDGYKGGACNVDCVDTDPAINPGAPEVCNDGVDNDCNLDTGDLQDADGDGFDCLADCNDADPFQRPSAAERCNDGIDNDCDPATPDVFDSDGDTYNCIDDCDDLDPDTNPGAIEICSDATDNDCDPGTPDVFDADEDNYDCTVDCNDSLFLINPGAQENCNDGLDNDCNPLTPDLFDADDDGMTCDADCDDSDPSRNDSVAEKCDDAVDNDCDTFTDGADPDCDAGCPDVDGDGYKGGACNVDCNDDDPSISPAAVEVCGDIVDNDCNPATEDDGDFDGDGVACTSDCDDAEPLRNPNLPEICNDGLDNDCDDLTVDVFNLDGDVDDCVADCDDNDPTVNSGQAEVGCDQKDNDCDPMTSDLADVDADGSFCTDPTAYGGGISSEVFQDATLVIGNNTLIRNSAPGGTGGGLWADDLFATSGMLIANNVFYDNDARLGGGLDHTASFGEIRNNDFFGNTGGDLYNGAGSTAIQTGNLFIDPQFASVAFDNYRLAPGSPLIDAADPPSSPIFDLDRLPRPIDGDGDMTAISDIGAFEYPSGEVFDLVFVGTHDLSWEVQDGGQVFNLYRGLLARLRQTGTYTQTGPVPEQFCALTSLDLPFNDTYEPARATAVFYLVTQEIAGVEGSLGNDFTGRLRPNDNPCP
jgi:hypothetical protein